jgi:autophagy-related protein 5
MLTDTKQADVIRNGKGNVYMGLSKDDSDTLWQAVQDRKFSSSCSPQPLRSSTLPLFHHKIRMNGMLIQAPDNLAKFNTINNKLLNPPGTPLRNIPLKIYLPTTSAVPSSGAEAEVATVQASIRTVQGLIAPFSATTRKFVVSLFLCFSFSFFFCSSLVSVGADSAVQVNQIHWVWR